MAEIKGAAPLWRQDIFTLIVYGPLLCATVYGGASELRKLSEETAEKSARFIQGSPYLLADSWILRDQKRDAADYEWLFWRSLWPTVLMLCFAHFLTVRLADYLASKTQLWVRSGLVLIVDFGCFVWLFGYQASIVFLGVHLTIYALLQFFDKYLRAVSFVIRTLLFISLYFVTSGQIDSFTTNFKTLSRGVFVTQNFFTYSCIIFASLFILREIDCVAFFTNLRLKPDAASTIRVARHEWLTTTLFLFYAPVSYSGPFIRYGSFRDRFIWKLQAAKEHRSMLGLLIRVLLAFIIIESSNHYIYVWALRTELFSMNGSVLFAHMIAQSVVFTIKYVAIYGVAAVFTELDGLRFAVWLPMSGVFWRPAILWREFDYGLYTFLKAHVYGPLESSRLPARRLLAIGAVFLLVLVFHGTNKSMAAWAFLNFAEVSIEHGLSYWLRRAGANVRPQILSYSIAASLRVPLLWLLGISMYFFYNGYDAGVHYVLVYCSDPQALMLSGLFFLSSLMVASYYRSFRNRAGDWRTF